MSHTVTIDVKFKDKEVAVKAAEAMGASVIGEGSHRLYSSSHSGLAIKFPGWNYPVVIDGDGKIFYDNYNGAWGNQSILERFQEEYSNKVIESTCESLGWYHERQPNGELVVHHPAGGTITIQKGGTLDATGFVGTSCQEATAPLEAALGLKLGSAYKPYLNEVEIRETE
jgi:hypothetical protein